VAQLKSPPLPVCFPDENRLISCPCVVMMKACALLVHTKIWSVVFGTSSKVCTEISRETGAPGTTPGLWNHGKY
jgi:hypothetical protein